MTKVAEKENKKVEVETKIAQPVDNKNGKPKDKHGFTTVSYLTDAIRGTQRAISMEPEIEKELAPILETLTQLRDARKTVVAKKAKTPEEIQKENERLERKLKANQAALAEAAKKA